MKAREFNRIWGKPWDWEYLLQIEKRKLKEMAEYFKRTQTTVGWEFQVRDCELCVKLIDINCEKDPYYKMWLENCYGETALKNGTFNKFHVTKHVNFNNIKRFLPNIDIDNKMIRFNCCGQHAGLSYKEFNEVSKEAFNDEVNKAIMELS